VADFGDEVQKMTKRFDKFSPVVEQRTEPKTFTNAILVVEEPIA
jgi:hypothetical protein